VFGKWVKEKEKDSQITLSLEELGFWSLVDV
jgi:hypothetical protein